MLETQRLASAAAAAVAGGRNLNAVLAAVWLRHPQLTSQQRGAITDLCYGTLRFGFQLEAVLTQLLAKPLRDEALRWLLLVALYQLQHTRAAPYAIVDHAVQCAARLGEPQAAGLINAVLRNFLRRREALLTKAAQTDAGRFAYPQWWIDKLRAQYPRYFAAVLEAGNLHPPFTVRINRRRTTRNAYLALLAQHDIRATAVGADAITLARALPVERLPGFADGVVSVQDAGAQLAAPLLDAQNGMRVLDACAAPGGKTTHLLEIADLELTALDNDAARLERVRQNLDRLRLDAELLAGSAHDAQAWWDGKSFQRILADVPCSASGVVRRHPDIKWLRRAADIPQFVLQQRRLLDSLWRLLASGGKLLYTTCSIFHEENSLQVADFLARHADAGRLPLRGVTTLDGTPEGLLLPDNEHDGFFYALLQKI
ncbi:MAG: 16S rRNA (cytosine(967)-C(5))-methyltransferase RsmB [Betaproteobacteria bacterium]|nr:16S rRNA (cytosine(967)-C(5))-methyltransferase RsmB [Betaproteobacteria bacterium]